MIHPDATRDECLDEIGALEREIERLSERLRVGATVIERERCADHFEKFVKWLADYAEREEGMRVIAAIRRGE